MLVLKIIHGYAKARLRPIGSEVTCRLRTETVPFISCSVDNKTKIVKMKKAIVFLVFSFSFIGCGVAQNSPSQIKKQGTETSVKLICTTGPLTPPLYILRYKKEDYLLDTAKLQYINPDDVKRVKVLKEKAALEKYGDKGKNGIVIVETNKPFTNLIHKIERY